MLTMLLPQFAIHAPETLIRTLPFCYAILGRVICWKSRTKAQDPVPGPSELEGEISKSQSSTQSRISDAELDPAATPATRSDLEWERLGTFISFSTFFSIFNVLQQMQRSFCQFLHPHHHYPYSAPCTVYTPATP